jgi:hypothetical protein
MNLTLTAREAELLAQVLHTALGEIRQQVYHAEDHGFKDALKADEDALRSVIAKVREAVSGQAAGR